MLVGRVANQKKGEGRVDKAVKKFNKPKQEDRQRNEIVISNHGARKHSQSFTHCGLNFKLGLQ